MDNTLTANFYVGIENDVFSGVIARDNDIEITWLPNAYDLMSLYGNRFIKKNSRMVF